MLKSSDIFLTSEKLEELLGNLGIRIIGETETDFLCLCCFHYNSDSPALNISKRPGHPWKCWNAKCALTGNIVSLITRKGYSINETKLMLIDGFVEPDDLTEYIKNLLAEDKKDVNGWRNRDVADFAREDEDYGHPALKYLESRGIQRRTYEYFRMGYSNKKKMLVIPIFNEFGEFVSVVGRSIQAKRYTYSKGFDRERTIWNVNNARTLDKSYIILTEGTLDAAYIWQAGWESVGAVFGASFSLNQLSICQRYFDEIICFLDNDDAGKALSNKIISTVKGIDVSVVQYPSGDIKDPEKLTVEQISEMIEKRRSAVELLLDI